MSFSFSYFKRLNLDMAVENKFKLNFVAASVLMGLSLSAVASDVAPSTDSKVTTPAKAKSDAGFNPVVVGRASESADQAKFEYKQSSAVSSLFDDTGDVGAYEAALNKAFGAKGALGNKELSTISEYLGAQAADVQAKKDWDSFASKARVINSEYQKALTGLYGADGHAFEDLSAGELTKPVSGDASAKGAFGAYVKGIQDFRSQLDKFRNLLIGSKSSGADNTGGEGGATGNPAIDTTVFGGTNEAALKEAADKVVAYRGYLQTWAKAQAADLKEKDAKAQIMATLPSLQHYVAAWGAYSGNNDKGSDLAAKYQAFSEAVTALAGADHGNGTDLTKAREAVKSKANELKTAIDAAKVLKGDGKTQGNIDNGDKTKFDGLMAGIQNAVTTMEKADNDRKDLKSLQKDGLAKLANLTPPITLPFDSGTPADTVNAIKVTSVQEALDGLKEAFTTLCQKGGTSCDTLSVKPADLKTSWEALMGAGGKGTDTASLHFKYHAALAKLNNLQGALTAINAEFSQQNKAYADARAAYFKAYDAYHATGFDGARTAYEALESAYKKLNTVSTDLKTAIQTAASGYAKDRKAGVSDATALTTSLSQLKTLIPVKLQVDSLILAYQQKAGQETDAGGLSVLAQLQSAYQAAGQAKTKASNDYDRAVEAYKAAESAYTAASKAGSGVDISQAETDLTLAARTLLVAAGYSKDVTALTFDKGMKSDLIEAVNKLHYPEKTAGVAPGTFMPYASITDSAFRPTALEEFNTAKDALTKGTVSTSRKNIADGLKNLADIRVLYTDKEWTALKIGTDKNGKGGQSLSDVYLSALEGVGVKATSAEEQKKVANAESVTHYLGWADVGVYDFAAGRYNPVILDADANGKVTGVKRAFTAADLYTGTQDKPFTTTVLNIEAPVMGGDNQAEANTITVGEAGTKDKKATPVDVWARTDSAEGAVKLNGDLKTAVSVAGENGAPEVIRGADRIVLQNMNIHNSILSDKVNTLKLDMVNIGLKINTSTVDSLLDKNIGQALENLATKGTFDTAAVKSAPKDANILLDKVNITMQNASEGGKSTAIQLSGSGNHILAKGGVFDAGSADAGANVLDITAGGENNRVDFVGSTLKGDIRSAAAGNTVNLVNGSLTGDAIADTGDLSLNLDGSTWTGAAGTASPDVSLSNNSVWNVKDFDGYGNSSVNSLSLHGSNLINLVDADGRAQLGGHGFAGVKSAVYLGVDNDLTSDGKGVTSVKAGTYSPDNLHSLTSTGLAGNYQFGTLYVNGLATGGKYALSLESSGAEPYTIGGRLADGHPGETSAHAFVSYKTSESRVVTGKDGKPVTQIVKSDADFISQSAPAEMGVYQYAAEKVMDGVNNRTNIYYSSTGKLSNSAATAVSLAAAPVDVANLESDTLAKHMNSVRHGKDSGVWVSYFGGENRNTTASGPEYTLKTNGVMLGADTLTENNWLAGVAVSSARSDMSVMNSSGDLNSYGAQFYMSRRYDSGVFVDSALQFNHFSNTAKARMVNGQQAKADFSGNSYGLEAKVGYAWNNDGFFAEPYVRAAARAFDGEHYALSNGMTVNSNDYKSMLGEVGADLGYQYAISGGYVKPYLHLAALNEFADGNSVRVNNVSLDNSVKGAAFQAGLGAEVKVTDNLGGYAAFDYTKGDNTERPWQATVGVNYTW
ncbi:TPA_asm: autotransporter outer membrane beta-barrel domain-containing protein [Salmonella enterica subsp. enterica serovar Typhimurium]|nr:autotransporter outer membrane beta-barrel domain-containing protein [Salmonella enterica subsp. enterica serovar Typhimurium]